MVNPCARSQVTSLFGAEQLWARGFTGSKVKRLFLSLELEASSIDHGLLFGFQELTILVLQLSWLQRKMFKELISVGKSFTKSLGVERKVFGSGRVPSMLGFVQQAMSIFNDLSGTVMLGFNPQNIPVFASLVQELAVFDRWFSSMLGPTQPNCLFVYSGTSQGAIGNDKWNLIRGYPQKTIFDSLIENGLDFSVYFRNIPTTLFYHNLRKLSVVSRD